MKQRRISKQGIKLLFVFAIYTLSFCRCKNEKTDKIREPYEICKQIPNKLNDVNYCKLYDADSNLIREGFYSNGVAVKWHQFYNKGKLSAEREYIQIEKDSSILNRVYAFNSLGDTNYSKSNFYKIKLKKDTFNIGDSIGLSISFDAPLYKNSKAEIQLKDNDNKSWISPLGSEKINFKLIPHFKEGEYKVQGNLIEYLIKEDSSVITRKLIIYEKYNVRR